MSEKGKELISLIRQSKIPSEALLIATNIILAFIK